MYTQSTLGEGEGVAASKKEGSRGKRGEGETWWEGVVSVSLECGEGCVGGEGQCCEDGNECDDSGGDMLTVTALRGGGGEAGGEEKR